MSAGEGEGGIGALRHRVKIEAPTHTPTDGGGALEVWGVVAVVSAEIKPLSGREVFEGDRMLSRDQFDIRIRFRDDVTAAMRIVFGGRVFDIRHVEDVEMRGRWLVCLCEEQEA